MHTSRVYPSVVERVEQRRGGLRVFDRLDSRRTAHIVVDLQNGFMAPGAVAEIPVARDMVPAVNRISATLRETGGAVVISAGATIAGFGVLGFAQIPVIAEFGIATALDLALVLLALVVIAPATWVLADREPAERPAAPPRPMGLGGRSSSLARDGRTTVG